VLESTPPLMATTTLFFNQEPLPAVPLTRPLSSKRLCRNVKKRFLEKGERRSGGKDLER